MKIFRNLLVILTILGAQQALTAQTLKQTKSDPNVPIFEVKNDLGQTVFAVYPGGVHIFIDDSQKKAAGGGFSVGRLSTGKAADEDYFTVNPGDVKVIIPATTAKAAGGGFSVGRLSTGKAAGDTVDYLRVTPDSTRIYTSETSDKGFAVGKLNVELGGSDNFLDLTPQNYFIGHESGVKTTGLYNLFLGYRTGYVNTLGYYNIFIGRESGYSNTVGRRNIFIGDRAGYSNVGNLTGNPPTIGHDNIYIGTFAGRDNVDGEHNTLIGSYSGYTSNGTKNTFLGAFTGFDASGTSNVFVGVDAGRNNTAGDNNVFLGAIAGNSNSGSNNTLVGFGAGYNNTSGSGNVFLGRYAGLNETGSNRLYIDNSSTTTPLIYGEFDSNLLIFNGSLGINGAPNSNYALEINLDGDDTYALVAFGDTWCSSGAWAGSDIRFKKNIETINNALEKVLKLRGVTYNYRTDEFIGKGFPKNKSVGLVAQEIEEVIPELVSEGPDGYKAVAYDKLTAVLIEAMKEQQSKIELLEKENIELKGQAEKIKELEAKIEKLTHLANALIKQNEKK